MSNLLFCGIFVDWRSPAFEKNLLKWFAMQESFPISFAFILKNWEIHRLFAIIEYEL